MAKCNAITAADLFCGAGGLSQGLSEAGISVVAAADHDPDACATHRLNFHDATLVEGDLTAREKHEELVSALAGDCLDVLAGGPPCQAYSQVRNHDRLIDDPRNSLYREFVSLLAEIRPRALILENVLGMKQLKGGAVREQVEQDLSLDGEYRVVSGVLDAGDFGTPQRRPRLVFIGIRADIGAEPLMPEGSGISRALRNGRSGQPIEKLLETNQGLHDALLDPWDARVVTVRQALSDLVEPGGQYSSDPASAFQRQVRRDSDFPQDHVPSRIRKDTQLRLEAIPPGGNVYDLPQRLLKRYLGDEKWGPTGNGQRLARRHYYAYRRLHPDWLAWTANTKADFAYHYEVPRGLSVREAARIQGFPDHFHFVTAPAGTPGQLKNGARHSRYRQVGNAVPPPLAAAIGRTISRQLSLKREPAVAIQSARDEASGRGLQPAGAC